MSRDSTTTREFLPALQRSLLKRSPFFDYIRGSDFKRLLGKIMTTVETSGARSLAVLSAGPGEGKTFLIAAIAAGYAILLQKRVLIVNTVLETADGSLDIRELYRDELQYAPVYAGKNTRNQMIDLISPQEQDRDKTQFDTVDFMIGKFLESFRSEYDLILVDTCPLSVQRTQTMDPVVIAGQADASVIVTSRSSLNPESVAMVKNLLDQWRVRVIGTVHNELPPEEEKR